MPAGFTPAEQIKSDMWREAVCLCRRNGGGFGRLAVALGMVILLALVLPNWFWWLVCSGLLIYGGCCILWR